MGGAGWVGGGGVRGKGGGPVCPPPPSHPPTPHKQSKLSMLCQLQPVHPPTHPPTTPLHSPPLHSPPHTSRASSPCMSCSPSTPLLTHPPHPPHPTPPHPTPHKQGKLSMLCELQHGSVHQLMLDEADIRGLEPGQELTPAAMDFFIR